MASDEFVDGRPRFLWCSLGAVEHLRALIPRGPALFAARSTYVGLAELAAVRYDGKHGGFDAVPEEIAAMAGMSARRVGAHLETLEAIGLLVITRQTNENGGSARSSYTLTEPTISVAEAREQLLALDQAREQRKTGPRSVGGDVSSSPEFRGDAASGVLTQRRTLRQDPTRARDNSEEVKEERGREGERAHATSEISGLGGDQSSIESTIVSAFDALLTQRDERLTASDRLAIRSAIGSAPDGVDLSAVVGRLERNYGPDGKAANQPIRSVGGLLCEEIRRSTARPADAERDTSRRGRSARRRVAATIVEPSMQHLKRHHVRPSLDPAPKDVVEAWGGVRRALQRSAGAWALVSSAALAGILTLLVDEAGGESDQPEQVIVLEADDSGLAWLVHNGRRSVVRLFEQTLQRDVRVELVPRALSASKAVAA